MWDEPVKGECPLCGGKVLAKKKQRGGPAYIGCPTKGCRYRQDGDSGE
jgi:DNA topoisomerase-1